MEDGIFQEPETSLDLVDTSTVSVASLDTDTQAQDEDGEQESAPRSFRTNARAGSVLESRVIALAAEGLIHGDETGFIDVENDITRREAFLLLFRAFDMTPSEEVRFAFDDISLADPFALQLDAAVDAGILSKNSRFRPDDTVTRAEFIKMLTEFADLPLPAPDSDIFADVGRADPFAAHIAAFARIIDLDTDVDESFFPHKTLPRKEAFSIVYTYRERGE